MKLSSQVLDDEEGLDLFCDSSGSFAMAAYFTGDGKKAADTMKNMVKTAEARKDRFPKIYAHALLERARFLN